MQSSREFGNSTNETSADAEEFKLNSLQSEESLSQGNLNCTSDDGSANLLDVISVDIQIPKKKTLKKY